MKTYVRRASEDLLRGNQHPYRAGGAARIRKKASLLAVLSTLAGALLLPAAGAGADEGREMSPAEIVQKALRHGQGLRSAEREAAAAAAVREQAAAANWASVDIEARAGHYEGVKDMAFGPGLVIPAIEDRYGVSVGITQPLYTGGALSARKEAAAWRLRAAEFGVEGQRAQTAYRAWLAYWNWSRAWYSVESLGAWVRWMEAHSADVGRRKKGGLATENEDLSAAVQLEQTRLRLEEARRRESMFRAEASRLTGTEIHPDARPHRPAVGEAPDLEPEADSVRTALASRPEREGLAMAQRAAEQQVDVQKAGYKPSVLLLLRYEQARPNMVNIPPEDEWQEDAFAGVQVAWKLFDWGLARGKVAEAEARVAQAGLQCESMDEEIVLEVRRARIDLQNAASRDAVARRAEAVARLNLKTATDLWKNGMARHSDVLDAQARLAQAEFDVIAGGADLAIAQAEVALAKGEMKEFVRRLGPLPPEE